MKKSIIVIALACVMIFAFAGVAMADHSPQFYFNFQAGAGVTTSPAFVGVFPTAAGLTFSIDNGAWGSTTNPATPHKGYSQTTAKCGVCHQIHRAPTRGTGSTAAPTTSSRYALNQYTSTATPDTQLLLKSTANGACAFCHIIGGHADMYGGDVTMAWVTNADSELSWNEFYGHTNGCTSCHAVHGAKTLPGSKILKYQGVKGLQGGIEMVVQPELYGTNYVWDAKGVQEKAPLLWASKADMIAGVLKSGLPSTVNLANAAVTANCSICHANYSGANNALINYKLNNMNLFQGGSWQLANGIDKSVSAVIGVSAGGWNYTDGAPGTEMMMYKNHPMKNAASTFKSPGTSLGNVVAGTKVSINDAYVCQSCHNAPGGVMDGTFVIQSFPHYTPGYYKFMAAQNQAAFSTPATKAQVDLGRIPFFEADSKHAPAIMNDGYCTKCHTNVGVDF